MTSAVEAALEQERQDDLFAAAQERFPTAYLLETSVGGYAAAVVITADDLDGLMAKLRKAGF